MTSGRGSRSREPNPEGGGRPGSTRALGWLVAAGLVGTVHAGASLHWAAGGTWLAETAGARASALASAGGSVGGTLVAVAVVKAVVAWGPVLVRGSVGVTRALTRRLALFVGLVLSAYGGVLTVIGVVALTGVFGTPEDPVALRGHALLWDPLFAVWGAFLVLGLRADARPVRVRAQSSVAGRERADLVSAR